MTELLEKAFAEVAKLPPDAQDEFAQWILEELEDEQRWEKSFEMSAEKLMKLASEALAEHRAGKTEQLNPDNL